MSAFDTAWSIVKMPWINEDYTHALSGKPVTIDGPLYSGGDTSDEPRYWTDDVSEALAYALFGSAIPRVSDALAQMISPNTKKMTASAAKNTLQALKHFQDNVKMRETIPQIWVAPDPGSAWRGIDGHIDESLLSENDDIQNYLLYGDPHSDAYMHDERWGAPEHAPMPRDELEAMIQQIVDSGDDYFRWGNTGTNMTQEARRAHILGALERLQTNTRGQIHLPDEVKPFVETSETDQITEMDDEDYLREWGRWGQ